MRTASEFNIFLLLLVISFSFSAAIGCGGGATTESDVASDETPSLDIEIPTAPTETASETPDPATPTAPADTSTEVFTAVPENDDAVAAVDTSSAPAAAEDLPVEAGWGHLRGRFVVDGEPPKPLPITVTKDQEYCGKFNLMDRSLVVNQDNGGIKNIIVWLYTRGNEQVKTHPSYDETANATVTLDNQNCMFEPHICVVRTTQKLEIKNSDPVGHNTKADLFANPSFNDNLPAGASITKEFAGPERLPGLVGCNIHPWMNGRLVVKEHPYVAVTDEDGNFVIKNLPEGDWTFQVYHELSGYVDEVTKENQPTEWRSGRFEMAVKSGINELGEIKINPAVFSE